MAASSTQATLDLEFVGNATGITDAVRASQRALAVLERQSATVSTTVGRAIRTIVAPIAGTILAAFAAKKALADFATSNLPGAGRFSQTMAVMRLAVRNLSNAVGEFLAPMAERTAAIITAIANKIAPLVRQVTAFTAASGGFLRVLGANIVKALQPLLPTVFAFIERVKTFFGTLDWQSLFDRIRQFWNKAWSAALNYMAPIIVAAAALVEATIAALRSGLAALGSWLATLIEQVASYFGVTLPGAANSLIQVLVGIQTAIVIGIGALQMAIMNVPMLFQTVVAAAGVAIEYLRANWAGMFTFMGSSSKAIGDYLLSLFTAIGKNVGNVLIAGFSFAFDTILVLMTRFTTQLSRGWINALSDGIQNMMNAAADAWDAMPTALKVLIDPLGVQGAGFGALRTAAKGIGLIADTYGGKVTDAEINRQNPLPGFKLPGRIPLPGAPNLPTWNGVPVDMTKLTDLLQQIKDKFGPGIAELMKEAFAKAPILAAQIAAGLPNINGTPAGALDRGGNVGALLFGTAQAFVAENNSGSTNPLIPLAQQQNQNGIMTNIYLRGMERAAQRKARIANF